MCEFILCFSASSFLDRGRNIGKTCSHTLQQSNFTKFCSPIHLQRKSCISTGPPGLTWVFCFLIIINFKPYYTFYHCSFEATVLLCVMQSNAADGRAFLSFSRARMRLSAHVRWEGGREEGGALEGEVARGWISCSVKGAK